MSRQCFTIVAAVALFASCSDRDSRLPFAPSATSTVPVATPSAGPGGTALVLGETWAGVVTEADPGCGIEFAPTPPEPCQRFKVSIARRGVLKVGLVTAGPDELTLGVAKRIYWGTAIGVTANVEAGATYEITVSLHSRKGSQAFDLTASLEPS